MVIVITGSGRIDNVGGGIVTIVVIADGCVVNASGGHSDDTGSRVIIVIIDAGGSGHVDNGGGIITIVNISGDGCGDDTGSRGQVVVVASTTVVGSSPSLSLLMAALSMQVVVVMAMTVVGCHQ